MLRQLFLTLLFCAAAVAVAQNTTTTQPIQVAGSDLLQLAVGEPLARYVKQNGLDVKVDLFGTAPALNALNENKAQLAIVAAPDGSPPALPGFQSIELCFQVDYILVNGDNPLNALTLQQLAGVFGASEQTIALWSDLHVAGIWATRPVTPCTTSSDDGVVLDLFKNAALGHLDLMPTVRVMPTATELVREVESNPEAIGLSGYDPGLPAKVLLISPTKPSTNALGETTPAEAVPPTDENVYDGSYPLRLPFYLVFKTADQDRLRELIRLILSDEFAGHLRDQHFMPVPATYRDRSLLELDKPQ